MAPALVTAMLKDPRLALVRQFLLRTRDAHGVYASPGFEGAPRPEELMARYL